MECIKELAPYIRSTPSKEERGAPQVGTPYIRTMSPREERAAPQVGAQPHKVNMKNLKARYGGRTNRRNCQPQEPPETQGAPETPRLDTFDHEKYCSRQGVRVTPLSPTRQENSQNKEDENEDDNKEVPSRGSCKNESICSEELELAQSIILHLEEQIVLLQEDFRRRTSELERAKDEKIKTLEEQLLSSELCANDLKMRYTNAMSSSKHNNDGDVWKKFKQSNGKTIKDEVILPLLTELSKAETVLENIKKIKQNNLTRKAHDEDKCHPNRQTQQFPYTVQPKETIQHADRSHISKQDRDYFVNRLMCEKALSERRKVECERITSEHAHQTKMYNQLKQDNCRAEAQLHALRKQLRKMHKTQQYAAKQQGNHNGVEDSVKEIDYHPGDGEADTLMMSITELEDLSNTLQNRLNDAFINDAKWENVIRELKARGGEC